MKVKFHFKESPVLLSATNDEEKLIQLNTSILKKLAETTVDLICTPTREMEIRLDTFQAELNLTDEEVDYIRENPYFDIEEICVTSEYLELWLIHNKE